MSGLCAEQAGDEPDALARRYLGLDDRRGEWVEASAAGICQALGTRENVTLDTGQRVVTKVERQLAAPIAQDYWNLVGIDLSRLTAAQAMSATLEPADKHQLSKQPQVYYFDGATAVSQSKTIKLLDCRSATSNVTTPAISITDVYAYIEGFARAGRRGALHELHFFRTRTTCWIHAAAADRSC